MTILQDKKNLLELSNEEKSILLQDCYDNEVRFTKKYGNTEFINLDVLEYSKKFRDQITRLLYKNNLIDQDIRLEELHTALSDEMKEYNFDYGVNKISTYFYDTDEEFLGLYHDFLKNVIYKEFPEEFYFQETPTIRIHCPNGKNSNHYPRYHSDIFYGHPHEEINIWMPLTHMIDNHGFSLCNFLDSKNMMSSFKYDRDEFIHNAINNQGFKDKIDKLGKQVNTQFGQVLLFDPRCMHSGYPMQTHTRISIDVRIILKRDFENLPIEYQGSGRRKVLFAPGGCYNSKTIQSI